MATKEVKSSLFAQWDVFMLRLLTDYLPGNDTFRLYKTGDSLLMHKLGLSVARFSPHLFFNWDSKFVFPTEFITTRLSRLTQLAVSSKSTHTRWCIEMPLVLPSTLTSICLRNVSLVVPSMDLLRGLAFPNLERVVLQRFYLVVDNMAASFTELVFPTATRLREFRLIAESQIYQGKEHGPYPDSIEEATLPAACLDEDLPPNLTSLMVYDGRSPKPQKPLPASLTKLFVHGLLIYARIGTSLLDLAPVSLQSLCLQPCGTMTQPVLLAVSRFTELQTLILNSSGVELNLLDLSVLPKSLTHTSYEMALLPHQWRHLNKYMTFTRPNTCPLAESLHSWYHTTMTVTADVWASCGAHIPANLTSIVLQDVVPAGLATMTCLSQVNLAITSLVLPNQLWCIYMANMPSCVRMLDIYMHTVPCLPWFDDKAKLRLSNLRALKVDCLESIPTAHIIDWFAHLPTTLTKLTFAVRMMGTTPLKTIELPPLSELTPAPIKHLMIDLSYAVLDLKVASSLPACLETCVIKALRLASDGPPVEDVLLPPGATLFRKSHEDCYHELRYTKPL